MRLSIQSVTLGSTSVTLVGIFVSFFLFSVIFFLLPISLLKHQIKVLALHQFDIKALALCHYLYG